MLFQCDVKYLKEKKNYGIKLKRICKKQLSTIKQRRSTIDEIRRNFKNMHEGKNSPRVVGWRNNVDAMQYAFVIKLLIKNRVFSGTVESDTANVVVAACRQLTGDGRRPVVTPAAAAARA